MTTTRGSVTFLECCWNLKWWIKRSNGYHDESVHANDGNSMVYVMIINVSYSCEMMKKCSWKQGQQKWKGHITTSWRMPLLPIGIRDQPISIACRCGWTFVTVRIHATCNTRGGGWHVALLCSTHPRGAHTLPLPTPPCDCQPRVGCFVRMPKNVGRCTRDFTIHAF